MDDLHVSANVSASRAQRKGQPNCRFVELDEFCTLAVSRRKLFRHDDAGAELRGLFEPDTGTLYCIEEERLLRVL
jgi:hypothetical protein